MDYKAIFFDRDGTLTMNDVSWEKIRDDSLTLWSGKPFQFSHELFMKHFKIVSSGEYSFVPYKNVDQELQFFKQWYISLFDELGIVEKVSERVDYLIDHLWYLKKELYPETIEVLKYFSSMGYKMGVISDCPPSLELTLLNCGIHKYFTSFTASSIVGVGKPDPKIFNEALKSLDVEAYQSIFIDDTFIEAEGARKIGFTSFFLDRSGNKNGDWIAKDLNDLILFIES